MSNTQESTIPCCPELIKDDNCDFMYFTRTLDYPFFFKNEIRIIVKLILKFKFSRCTKGLVLGDPAYTTTLLPGEKVRIFTMDRKSKFSFDSSTQLSYRTEQLSEEDYFMLAAQTYYGNLDNSQSGSARASESGSWDYSGEASSGLGWFSVGAEASAEGSHTNTSTLDYLYRQSSNMRSAAAQGVRATKMAHSISIGEVSIRKHAEGETESHYEASSRVFKNDNNCHALTYVFYRLNKKQVVRFELASIDKIISTEQNRKIDPGMRNEILADLDNELREAGILDKKGEISDELHKKFGFYLEFSIPTSGIQVKGCLDECNTCEPEKGRYHKLQNDLLKRQIELLDNSQEYRCCPEAPIIAD